MRPVNQIATRTISNAACAWTPAVGYAIQTGRAEGLHRFFTDRAATPTYSTRGDLTAGAGQTFGYDADGRLTSAGSASFAYDPLGRFSSDGGSGTRFLYDGWELVGEYPSSGTTLSARHIPGAGLDDTIATYTSSGATFWLRDERNSTIAQTDSTGAAVAINTYDEYGLPAAANGGRFQYAGRVRLPGATGLYDYRTRAYSADLGRFLQPDTVGYSAALNLYAYVGDDPVNATDPWGMQEVAPCPNPTCVDTPCWDITCGEIVVTGQRPSGRQRVDVQWLEWFRGWLSDQITERYCPSCREGDFSLPRVPEMTLPACPTGSRILWSPMFTNMSGTVFAGRSGFSLSNGLSLALPTNFFSTGSIRGMQIVQSTTSAALVGRGFFGGGGPAEGIGYSNGPIISGQSGSAVVAAGGGTDLTAELMANVAPASQTPGGSFTPGFHGGPRTAAGSYIAGGVAHTTVVASPQLGCL